MSLKVIEMFSMNVAKRNAIDYEGKEIESTDSGSSCSVLRTRC